MAKTIAKRASTCLYWNFLGVDENIYHNHLPLCSNNDGIRESDISSSSSSSSSETIIRKNCKKLKRTAFLKEDSGGDGDKEEKTEDYIKIFEQKAMDLREKIEQLNELYERKYQFELKNETIPQSELLKLVMKAWLNCNYSIPKDTESKRKATLINRGELRDRLNAYLIKLGFQEIGNKDPLWCEWFLEDCVGLDKKERVTGKPIHLEIHRSKTQTKKSLQMIIDQIEEEERLEREGEPTNFL